MLHTISTQNTSSESTFAWVKELLARGKHEVLSSDEQTRRIETEHAVFLVLEKETDIYQTGFGSAFVDATNKHKNFAILAPGLAGVAIDTINAMDYPGVAAASHRNDVLAPKFILATTTSAIEQAVTEMTRVNRALQALGTIYALQNKYWLLPLLGVAATIEDIVHAPASFVNPTFSVLDAVVVCTFIVWIIGRQRVQAARLGYRRLIRQKA